MHTFMEETFWEAWSVSLSFDLICFTFPSSVGSVCETPCGQVSINKYATPAMYLNHLQNSTRLAPGEDHT